MDAEFDWREFFGCLDLPEKALLAFIDGTRVAAFYVLAEVIDASASSIHLTGIRYEVFKQTYTVGEFYLGDEDPIRFYELDRPLFRGLRTYFNSGDPERCLTVGVWNSV